MEVISNDVGEGGSRNEENGGTSGGEESGESSDENDAESSENSAGGSDENSAKGNGEERHECGDKEDGRGIEEPGATRRLEPRKRGKLIY